MNSSSKRTTALRIHVSGLRYQTQKEKIDAKLNIYRAQYPYLDISMSDGCDINNHLSQADFVAITGSTLGNNSLDQLLRMSRNCGHVILQGQSAIIHPRYLFEAGVSLVVTSIKPVAVAEAAADRTGRALPVSRRSPSAYLPFTDCSCTETVRALRISLVYAAQANPFACKDALYLLEDLKACGLLPAN